MQPKFPRLLLPALAELARLGRLARLSRPHALLAPVLALSLALLPARAAAPTEQGLRLARAQAAGSRAVADEGRVIVKYRSASALMRPLSQAGLRDAAAATQPAAVRPQHAATLGQRLGLPLQDGRVLGERTQALRAPGLASTALAAMLRAQDDVEWAVVDERRTIAAAPNDPYFGPNQTSITPAVGQWYLRAPDADVTSATRPVVSSINAEAAWAVTPGLASVTVAVLDTGVRFDHPDLAAKLWPGYDFVTSQTNDGGSRDADASDPGDYRLANQCSNAPGAGSSSWHGTQTAGLVGAATNNSVGIASIGRNVMVLPVRVLGPCGGSDSDIIAAMYWAAGLALPGDTTTPANPHPAQVISMSLGKAGACPTSYNDAFAALAAARVTVVVAAGNDAGLAVSAPANCTGALAVAGLRHIGSKVGYSNIGPEVAIAAPAGNCVNTSGACLYPMLTTINLGSTTPSSNGYSDSSNYSVGTSFAAPLVAGTVGLMVSVDPTLTPARVKALLQATARPFPASGSSDTGVVACRAPSSAEQSECYCSTATCGAGMMDAGAAVLAVQVQASAPPTVTINAATLAPSAGDAVVLSAAGLTVSGARSIASYQWRISAGSSLASFSGSTAASLATLVTSAPGSVSVTLTVTDSAGASGSASTTLTVQAAAVPAPLPSAGGGAASPLWLALLALASAGLYRLRRP